MKDVPKAGELGDEQYAEQETAPDKDAHAPRQLPDLLASQQKPKRQGARETYKSKALRISLNADHLVGMCRRKLSPRALRPKHSFFTQSRTHSPGKGDMSTSIWLTALRTQ